MTPVKYPKPLRLVHWLRAAVLLAALAIGAVMTLLDDELATKFELLYPTHKQLGVLALLVVLLQLLLRGLLKAPDLPHAMPAWERSAAKLGHVMLYVLAIAVPVMGYSMSSSFQHSDGVPFLTFMLPELLPKSDLWFERFQLLHKVLAYSLLALIVVHIAAAFKHRLIDKDPALDVLDRML